MVAVAPVRVPLIMLGTVTATMVEVVEGSLERTERVAVAPALAVKEITGTLYAGFEVMIAVPASMAWHCYVS